MAKVCSMELLRDLWQHSLLLETSSKLLKLVLADEIKKNAFFSQGNDEVPDPDEFSPLFPMKAWLIINNDIILVVQYFFASFNVLLAFNATMIILVRNVPIPLKVMDFMPISCCYVVYKYITLF
ncbi:hypothetical protein V6N11_053383 [Hibiscus sabdariffa]|uniref:Uncharacterized protein n=1 Tax=Hibiscus sabdariffa TaxID=183260 RepID=A0ABR2UD73_9ROSI